ncbi:MAG: hypothetical protein WC366_00895 [Bacilli bacterium]
MEKKKLFLSPKRMMITFGALCLLMEILILGSGFLLSWEYMVTNYIVTIIIASSIIILCAFLCFIGLKTSYYIVDKKGIYYHKSGGDLYYEFKSILYIDEIYTKKHHVMHCYTDLGKELFIVFDTNGLIYEYALEYCDRLLNKEEFMRRSPNIKL